MGLEIIDNLYVRFGEAIREKRDSLGLTQEELANEVGMNRVSLAKLEKGRQRVLFHDGVKLCSRLGISLDDLSRFISSNVIDKKLAEQSKKLQAYLTPLVKEGTKK